MGFDSGVRVEGRIVTGDGVDSPPVTPRYEAAGARFAESIRLASLA